MSSISDNLWSAVEQTMPSVSDAKERSVAYELAVLDLSDLAVDNAHRYNLSIKLARMNSMVATMHTKCLYFLKTHCGGTGTCRYTPLVAPSAVAPGAMDRLICSLVQAKQTWVANDITFTPNSTASATLVLVNVPLKSSVKRAVVSQTRSYRVCWKFVCESDADDCERHVLRAKSLELKFKQSAARR